MAKQWFETLSDRFESAKKNVLELEKRGVARDNPGYKYLLGYLDGLSMARNICFQAGQDRD